MSKSKIIKISLVLTTVLLIMGAGFWFFNSGDSGTGAGGVRGPNINTGVNSAIKIVAFGDSLTAGYGLNLSESYPAQLESYLRKKGFNVSVVNAGVSGETTRGNKERANFIASQNPDIVILGIGGNDALRLLPISDTKKNIEETVDILKNGSASGGKSPKAIMLLKMQAPLTAGIAYKRDFDAIYKDIAKDKDLILVPFLTTELFLDVNNKLPDGIHYNQEGYRKAVEMYVAPAVEKLLRR